MTTTTLRRRARVAAVLLLAAGSALSWVPAASAVTVDASGWWWRPNSTAVPIDVPPRADVGPDQLLVEGEPEGATAVAAVRFKLSEGESSPILRITPTQDSIVPPNAVVLACRVSSTWEPAQGGKWERKPIPDCFTSVQGVASAEGPITFGLTPLQSGPDLEVLLVPGAAPESVNDAAKGSSFSLKFAKPTAADLTTSSGDAGGFSGTGGDFTPPDPSSFGSDADSSGAGTSLDAGSSDATSDFTTGGSTSFGPSPAFSQPSSFTPPTASAPVATPSLSASEQAGPTGVAPVQAAPAANSAAPTRGRTLGILVLLAGAALGFWAYSGSTAGRGAPVAPVAPPPGTDPVVGGLGRFARPRVGPPPSLS